MAGALMATAPMIIIFLFLQKYFIEGIALSGVKG
jgi:multiple sugar transport system permease protein